MVLINKRGEKADLRMSIDDFLYLEEVHRKIDAAFLTRITHPRKVSLSLEFRERLTELKTKYGL